MAEDKDKSEEKVKSGKLKVESEDKSDIKEVKGEVKSKGKKDDKKGDKKDDTKKAVKPKKGKKKVKKAVPKGRVNILASFNNTIITISDEKGDVIAWSSSGSSGFRGARKSTPYAAQVAAENAVEKASIYGLTSVNIYVKGVGSGREQAVRGIQGKGIEIESIIDVTPIPHNGCRKKKQRRV